MESEGFVQVIPKPLCPGEETDPEGSSLAGRDPRGILNRILSSEPFYHFDSQVCTAPPQLPASGVGPTNKQAPPGHLELSREHHPVSSVTAYPSAPAVKQCGTKERLGRGADGESAPKDRIMVALSPRPGVLGVLI